MVSVTSEWVYCKSIKWKRKGVFMKCVYAIVNKVNGKMYIGQTTNYYSRKSNHLYLLRKDNESKDVNRLLYKDFKLYGEENFEFKILKETEDVDDLLKTEYEMILKYDSVDNGYNLRIDSPDGMITHESTKKIQSYNFRGEGNPNYGNYWSDEMKTNMSNIQKQRHEDGVYGEEWKSKLRITSSEIWKDEDKKARMAEKVSKSKMKYTFEQYTKDGEFVKEWDSIKDIIESNPTYKWQNIYSVCNGYKKTIYGYVWKKKPKI